MTDVVQQLRRGQEHLRRHGWLQGEFGSSLGPSCIMAALAYGNGREAVYALDEGDSLREAWQALDRAASARLVVLTERRRSNAVVEYNNDVATSILDALQLYDEAIAYASGGRAERD